MRYEVENKGMIAFIALCGLLFWDVCQYLNVSFIDIPSESYSLNYILLILWISTTHIKVKRTKEKD